MHGDGSSPVTGFSELTLETGDVPALVAFYRDAIGLRVLAEAEDRVWLAVGERARLGIWTPGRKEFGDRGGTHVHFAFTVSPGGLDDLAGRLRDGGHDPEGPVEHDGGDRSLYVRDPAGNLVEAWDFFRRDPGRVEGVEALADG